MLRIYSRYFRAGSAIAEPVVASHDTHFVASPVLAVREYRIAADEVQWDYAPAFPINPMTGKEFTAEQRVFVEQGIGRRYLKRPLHGCDP